MLFLIVVAIVFVITMLISNALQRLFMKLTGADIMFFSVRNKCIWCLLIAVLVASGLGL